MHFLQAINSDISVLIVGNKTGGAIKEDIKKPLCYIVNYLCYPGISRISQTDYYFLFRLLTGYPKFRVFWSNDLSPFTKGYLNGSLL